MIRHHGLVRPFTACLLLGSAILTLGVGCSQKNLASEGASDSSPVPAAKSASGPTTAAVPAGSSGSEVEAVKQTLTRMQSAKNFTEMADYLSNDTAAALGIVMTIPLAMATSMQDIAGSFGGKSGAQTPKIDPTLKTDLENLMKKYGLDPKSGPSSDAQAKLSARGREFLKEVGGLLDRMKTDGKSIGPNAAASAPGMGFKPDQVEYKVVSPTEVSITPKPGVNDKGMALKAIVEEGHWRLDMGGFKDFGKGMGGSMPPGGMPPGGMGVPPAGFGK